MDILKPVTSAVRSCSKDCSMVLAYLLLFTMLPIDSLAGVNIQKQIKSTLSQVFDNTIGHAVVAVLFFVIWSTNDVMLLLLFSVTVNSGILSK